MLNNLTVKQKLLLMLLLPMLGFLGFGGMMVNENVTLLSSSSQIIKDTEGFVNIGSLVHNIQKERGTTLAFVGSHGEKMADKLPVIRTDSDKAFKILLVEATGDDLKQFTTLKNNLDEVRKKADVFQGSKDEFAAEYTKIIESFLTVISLTTQKITDNKTSQVANSYLSYLNMKERTGRIRARVAAILTNGKTDLPTLLKVSANISAFEVALAQFKNQATPEQIAFYEKTVIGKPVEEVERIKKLVLTSPLDVELGVDVGYWMEVMTARIDMMKIVEDKLAVDLKVQAQTLKNEMLMNLSIISVIVGIIFFFTLLFIRVIVNQLMAQLGGEPAYVANIVRQISNGDLSGKVQLLPNDKKSLLYSITRMREALNNTIISVNITMSEIAQGDLKSRITGDFKGDYNKIKTDMNSSLDTIDATLNEVMRVTNAISNGDLKQQITGEYHGSFRKTKDSVNQTVDALNKLVDEIDSIVYSGADCGDFSVKMTIQDKVGYGKRLAELINKLFETTEHSLTDVLRVAESLAKGDLTQTIEDDYVGAFAAVKVGMNSTVENLKSLIGEIQATSEVIATASNEISAGNNDLSHRTEAQAASLEETAASMEELAATVQTNTENAKHANELAVDASKTAQKGVRVVNNVVSTMVSINESSHRIVDIVSVIDDIAFQTNILALNAAVEAARAGEQGKGFAVVAVEVRNLAQRAANAAGEVKQLISESVERINDGSQQVAQAGKTMEDIVSAIQEVATIISGIASASSEQNAGIDQVHEAVVQMDGVTQQNAALVEQAAAAAESLSEQTRNLANEMAHFKIR